MITTEKRLLTNLVKKGFLPHSQERDIKINRTNAKYNQKSIEDIRYLPDTSIIKDDSFTVSKFDGENIIYTKRIYDKKSSDSFDYIPDGSMKDAYLNTVTFFNRFYKDVQVIHMVEGSFNKPLASSKDIDSDLKFVVKNEIVRFSVDQSLMKRFIIIENGKKKPNQKLVEDYKIINITDLKDFSLIEDVFKQVTNGMNNENIEFSLSQPLELLKKNLVLSEMLYI